MSELIIRNHPPDRRLVRVPISFDLLIEMVTQGSLHMGRNRLGLAPTCVKGLPSDAAFIGSYTDDARARGYLVFYHPSFDPAPAHEELPEFIPEFRAENHIEPFEGLRIEFPAVGEVIVRRQPHTVEAQYVKPNPQDYEQVVEFEDGTILRQNHQMIEREDCFNFTSKRIPLQDRVRYVRDAEKNPNQSFIYEFPKGEKGK